MTPEEIQKREFRCNICVVDKLVEWIGHSNDAAEDGDRGRADNAIALLLFDDGSGRVMIRKGLEDLGEIEIDGHQTLFEFDSIDELRSKATDL